MEEGGAEEKTPFLNIFYNYCNRDCSHMYSDREKFGHESGQHDPVRIDCARSVQVNKGVRQSPTYDSETRAEPTERRNISIEDLSGMIDEQEKLSREQKEQLFNVLLKYVNNFTSRPGRCRVYTHGFQVNSHADIRSPTRLIPFSLREAVRREINQTIREGILEVSKSPHVNSLVIVNREGKPPRNCLDARKMNEITISDAERENLLRSCYSFPMGQNSRPAWT
jgi:hypothetical protein